ncbi:stage II sporulation protein M [Roseivirga sp.]|uniref:stage II sporulation protein M n=1 Tax=Roseivirga sp. TaxID=1964215 RepID=UPI003B5165E4
MRESAFVKRNVKKWEEFEKLLLNPNAEPDKLSELFIQVTDDLAFARTQYPESRTYIYLNDLASKIHGKIYKNKAEDRKRFIEFWKFEVPLIMYHARFKLLYAFIIFAISIAIGVVSQQADPDFVRTILGDGYVNMTLENIEEGDVLAVYGREDEMDSFFGITFNNVRVSFFAFAAGLILSLGTGFLLFQNGVMVGCFFTFLSQQGFMGEAFKVVMLHGTLELSAIVIAGAAGFVMGNSILFPGTYSRMASFKKGAIRGLKIVMGLMPVFIMAGFIEGFFTRYTSMPWVISGTIILGSALFIIYYYILYPIKIANERQKII